MHHGRVLLAAPGGPAEEGFSGVACGGPRRCTDPFSEECFATKPEAVKNVRGSVGLKNVQIAKGVNAILVKNSLSRGVDGVKVKVMAGLPSNIFLADEFWVDFFRLLHLQSECIYNTTSEGVTAVSSSTLLETLQRKSFVELYAMGPMMSTPCYS